MLLSYRVVPSSPSNAFKLLPFKYQTTGSALPALFVEMGARLAVSPPKIVAHHLIVGMGAWPGAAGFSSSDMMLELLVPFGHCEPAPVDNAMCVPEAVVYALGVVNREEVVVLATAMSAN